MIGNLKTRTVRLRFLPPCNQRADEESASPTLLARAMNHFNPSRGRPSRVLLLISLHALLAVVAGTAAANATSAGASATATAPAAAGTGRCPPLSRDIFAAAARDNYVMLAVMNSEQWHFGANWLHHARAAGIDYYVVAAVDEGVSRRLAGLGERCFEFIDEEIPRLGGWRWGITRRALPALEATRRTQARLRVRQPHAPPLPPPRAQAWCGARRAGAA